METPTPRARDGGVGRELEPAPEAGRGSVAATLAERVPTPARAAACANATPTPTGFPKPLFLTRPVAW